MGWCKTVTTFKQFLKPDKRKIVIFAVIIILANLPVIGYTTAPSLCEPCEPLPDCCPDKMILNIIFYPLLQYFSGHYLKISDWTYGIPTLGIIRYLIWWPSIGNISTTFVSFFLLIGNIIYWYLISCLIVWIYDKVEKKKK